MANISNILILISLCISACLCQDTTTVTDSQLNHAQIWGFGVLAGLGVSCIGFIAAIVLVAAKKCCNLQCFQILMKFLFSLSCGALIGDAVIHILAEAYANEEIDKKIVSLIFIASIFMFLIFDRLLHTFGIAHAHWVGEKCEGQRQNHGHHHHALSQNNHPHQIKNDENQIQGKDQKINPQQLKNSQKSNQINKNLSNNHQHSLKNNYQGQHKCKHSHHHQHQHQHHNHNHHGHQHNHKHNHKHDQNNNMKNSIKQRQASASILNYEINLQDRHYGEQCVQKTLQKKQQKLTSQQIQSKQKLQTSQKKNSQLLNQNQKQSKQDDKESKCCDFGGKGSAGYINIFGSIIHNFFDGLAIGIAFATGNSQEIIPVVVAIIAHEIPRQLGDVAILLRSSFTEYQTIFCNGFVNFLSLIGVFVGLSIVNMSQVAKQYIMVFVAGNFIYIASDIWQHILKNKGEKAKLNNTLQFIGLATGIGSMFLLTLLQK